MKNKLYLAGKISGDPDYRGKFAAAERKLKAYGNVVLSPAWMPEGLEQSDYMRICMAMLDSADAVMFLPDYQQSEGAMVEWHYCRRIGKKILYFLSGPEEERLRCSSSQAIGLVKEGVE